MILRREGVMQNSEMGTGDILSLELQMQDVDALIDDGYTMTRFHGLGGHIANIKGWAREDKIHIHLEDEAIETADTKQIASLDLDPGGDLHFRLYDIEDRLAAAAGCEVLDVESAVTSDPSNKLQRLGIHTVRFYYLSAIDTTRRNRATDAWLARQRH